MKKLQRDLTVLEVTQLASDAFILKLEADVTLSGIVPGQFAEILVPDSPQTFLRRPISIHDIDIENRTVTFLIKKVGKGTEKLSLLKPGECVNVIFPLGNGFTFDRSACKHPLLIGGGVGVAPLYLLAKDLTGKSIEPTFLFGGKSHESLLRLAEFERLGRVFATTEDGSYGQKGFATDHTILTDEKFDMIFVCGPTPMMKAVAKYARKEVIPCQVSLEHKMACGIGACLCCVEETREGNLCVCKEGPVFNIERLLWQD